MKLRTDNVTEDRCEISDDVLNFCHVEKTDVFLCKLLPHTLRSDKCSSGGDQEQLVAF